MNEIVTLKDDNATPLAVRSNPEKYPRISKTDPKHAQVYMANIIYSAFLYSGRKIDKEMLTYTANQLLLELMQDDEHLGTRNLSWVEIARAVRRGILGQGEKMYGISVATLYEAIANYLTNVVIPAQNEVKKNKQLEHVDNSMDTIINKYSSMMAKANKEKEK